MYSSLVKSLHVRTDGFTALFDGGTYMERGGWSGLERFWTLMNFRQAW